MFTCFYVSLQPIIPVITIIGIFLMYWIEKFTLLKRSRKPIPCNSLINNAMIQFLYAGPLFYSVGSLLWSNFLTEYLHSGSLPNIIAIIISLIILMIPYRKTASSI